MKPYMFRTVPLSIIRSFFTVHSPMVYVIQVCCHNIAVCTLKKPPDDGQRNCPKHVEFHSKYKFEKLVHLVGFIVRNLPLTVFLVYFLLFDMLTKEYLEKYSGTFPTPRTPLWRSEIEVSLCSQSATSPNTSFSSVLSPVPFVSEWKLTYFVAHTKI